MDILETGEKFNNFYETNVKSLDITATFVPEKKVDSDLDLMNGHPVILTSNCTPTLSQSSVEISLTSEIRNKKRGRKYLGISLTLLSGLLYSLTSLLFKLLKDEFHTFTISFWRFLGILIPSVILILFRACCMKQNDFKSVWPLNDKRKAKTFMFLTLRGILGCWGHVLLFYSLLYLQAADSMVITSSTSVFVTLLAHCFIGEKCALVPIIAAFLTMGGVFVISRPPMLTGNQTFDTNILIGIGLAFGCMFVAAVVMVIQRHLRIVHFSLTSFSSGFWGTMQCAVLSVWFGVFKLPYSQKDIFLASSMGIVTFFAQASIILALKFEQAGPVSIVQSCDVIFAFMWQFVLLGVVPDVFSLVGAFIIIIGVLLTAFRKYLTTLPEDHQTRTRLRFLLL